jgi:hypothetical protein
MKDIMLIEIQKRDNQKKNLRTLVLSTDANDYDTGEPIIDGNIRNTLVSGMKQYVDNPILASLHGVVVGRKYGERCLSSETPAKIGCTRADGLSNGKNNEDKRSESRFTSQSHYKAIMAKENPVTSSKL